MPPLSNTHRTPEALHLRDASTGTTCAILPPLTWMSTVAKPSRSASRSQTPRRQQTGTVASSNQYCPEGRTPLQWLPIGLCHLSKCQKGLACKRFGSNSQANVIWEQATAVPARLTVLARAQKSEGCCPLAARAKSVFGKTVSSQPADTTRDQGRHQSWAATLCPQWLLVGAPLPTRGWLLRALWFVSSFSHSCYQFPYGCPLGIDCRDQELSVRPLNQQQHCSRQCTLQRSGATPPASCVDHVGQQSPAKTLFASPWSWCWG